MPSSESFQHSKNLPHISTRKQYRLHPKTHSSINQKNASPSDGKNPSDLLTPQFISKETLLTLDMASHVNQIFHTIQEKEEFIEILSHDFCRNPQLDLTTYSGNLIQPFLEAHFIQPVVPYALPDLNGIRIAAVDGGLGFRQYLGLQITLIKVAVVMYEFRSTQKTAILNFPPLHRDENYCMYSDQGAVLENSGKTLAGLRRTISENSMLLTFLKSAPEKPDIAILDGSLNFPPLPVATHNKALIVKHYEACIDSYLKLFEYCSHQRILLVGSVKDTHSTALRDLLKRVLPFFLAQLTSSHKISQIGYRKLLDQFFDTDLFFKILSPLERTSIIRTDYLVTPSHISKSTLNKFPLYSTYVQLSPYDTPLRIEFLGSEDKTSSVSKFSRLIRILYPISCINPQCTLPIPQLEAHLRAHLREEEMEVVVRQLKTQYQIKKMENMAEINKKNPDLSIKSYYSTFLNSRHDRMDSLF